MIMFLHGKINNLRIYSEIQIISEEPTYYSRFVELEVKLAGKNTELEIKLASKNTHT